MTESVWLIIGFVGQGIFFMRWLVQWLASERSAESRVPIGFWYMSLGGGLITLAYAIYRKDPVFIAGQSVGAFVYIRNLMLIYKAPSRASMSSPQSPIPSTPKGER
jgi:lipid-A-disaccharide synthase-like uncharacterized protein